MSIRSAAIVVALLGCVHPAHAHGIAGNRYFDGTLTFDDPAVADEAIVPNYSNLDHPAQGSNVAENRIDWSFARLLTPTLALTFDSGWVHQNWPVGHTSGFDAVDEAALRRAGNNLRALIYDPDSALHPRTIRILEDILIGVDHE